MVSVIVEAGGGSEGREEKLNKDSNPLQKM